MPRYECTDPSVYGTIKLYPPIIIPFNQQKDEPGLRDDQDKPRYDLIPALPLDELAKQYSFGALRYGDRNWEKGMSWSRVFGSMMRHAWAWWRGEAFDKESKCHHLAAVAWGAFALMEYEWMAKGTDNRPNTRKENLNG